MVRVARGKVGDELCRKQVRNRKKFGSSVEALWEFVFIQFHLTEWDFHMDSTALHLLIMLFNCLMIVGDVVCGTVDI